MPKCVVFDPGINAVMERANRRDDVVIKASASQSVNLGFISQVESYQKRLQKTVFTASLLGAHQKRDGVENKPTSLLGVSLGKTLNEMPPPLSDR